MNYIIILCIDCHFETPLGQLWDSSGTHLGHILDTSKTPLGHLDDTGTPLEHFWDTSGTPMGLWDYSKMSVLGAIAQV